MYTITKRFEFEASHKLKLDYESPCSNMHGHSYKVEITVKGRTLDDNGMITDFSNLKPIKEWVMDNWDHSTIIPVELATEEVCDVCGNVYMFPHHNVTAELMCKFLHEKACQILKQPENCIVIRINETANNWATFAVE